MAAENRYASLPGKANPTRITKPTSMEPSLEEVEQWRELMQTVLTASTPATTTSAQTAVKKGAKKITGRKVTSPDAAAARAAMNAAFGRLAEHYLWISSELHHNRTGNHGIQEAARIAEAHRKAISSLTEELKSARRSAENWRHEAGRLTADNAALQRYMPAPGEPIVDVSPQTFRWSRCFWCPDVVGEGPWELVGTKHDPAPHFAVCASCAVLVRQGKVPPRVMPDIAPTAPFQRGCREPTRSASEGLPCDPAGHEILSLVKKHVPSVADVRSWRRFSDTLGTLFNPPRGQSETSDTREHEIRSAALALVMYVQTYLPANADDQAETPHMRFAIVKRRWRSSMDREQVPMDDDDALPS